MLVANHLKAVDSVLIGLACRRQISFLAKSEYFRENSLKGVLVSGIFRLIGQISVDRSGGKAVPALEQAVNRLGKGKVVGIHVEGTRSLDGRLYDAQRGFALIAKKSKATVVPVAEVYHGDEVAEVLFGDPIPYSEYRVWSTKHFASEVTKRIQHLSKQDLAGRVADIASKVRGALPGAK